MTSRISIVFKKRFFHLFTFLCSNLGYFLFLTCYIILNVLHFCWFFRSPDDFHSFRQGRDEDVKQLTRDGFTFFPHLWKWNSKLTSTNVPDRLPPRTDLKDWVHLGYSYGFEIHLELTRLIDWREHRLEIRNWGFQTFVKELLKIALAFCK